MKKRARSWMPAPPGSHILGADEDVLEALAAAGLMLDEPDEPSSSPCVRTPKWPVFVTLTCLDLTGYLAHAANHYRFTLPPPDTRIFSEQTVDTYCLFEPPGRPPGPGEVPRAPTATLRPTSNVPRVWERWHEQHQNNSALSRLFSEQTAPPHSI